MKVTSQSKGWILGIAGLSSIIALLKNTMAANTGSALMTKAGRDTRDPRSLAAARSGLSGFSTSTYCPSRMITMTMMPTGTAKLTRSIITAFTGATR